MKKGRIIVLLLSFFIVWNVNCISSLAYESENTSRVDERARKKSFQLNVFRYEIGVEISRTYNSRNDIPDTYSYSIYDNNLSCWLSGDLKLKSVEFQNNKYRATFSGKIGAFINWTLFCFNSNL